MAKDWMLLQLGMHLQLGILWYQLKKVIATNKEIQQSVCLHLLPAT